MKLKRFALMLLMMASIILPRDTISADGAELHTFHYLHGCPTGASAINDVVVCEIDTLSSYAFTKQAEWVPIE